jgi:hypothetical protein
MGMEIFCNVKGCGSTTATGFVDLGFEAVTYRAKFSFASSPNCMNGSHFSPSGSSVAATSSFFFAALSFLVGFSSFLSNQHN